MPFGTWDFELDLSYIDGGEAVADSALQSFLGCYRAACGSGGFFLFTDPNDNTVSQIDGVLLNVTPGAAAPMGKTGDGVSTKFQLARTIGQSDDVIQSIEGAQIYVNGLPATGAISTTGVVTFDSAPPADAMLSWDGSFRYLCQFTDDTIADLARVSRDKKGFLWSATIAFESVLL
jgi:hypothetical protein